MRKLRLTLQGQITLLAAGSAIIGAILATAIAWMILDRQIQKNATARLDRAADVVADEYKNLTEGAQIIVGLYSERATLKTQVSTNDRAAIADALSNATTLRAIHFLQVVDITGDVLARVDLGEPATGGQSVLQNSNFQRALAGQGLDGLDIDDRGRLQLSVSRPMFFRNQLVGAVQGGFFLDQRFVDRLKGVTGADIGLYFGTTPFASTFPHRADEPLVPLAFNEVVAAGSTEHLLEMQDGASRIRYYPLAGPDNVVIGMYTVGLRATVLEELRAETVRTFGPLALSIILIASAAAALLAHRFTRPLQQLVEEARRIGGGDLESPVSVRGIDVTSAGEIAALGRAMEEMRARLQQLNRSREEYLFTVAHELQTPLSALSASAESLATDDAEMGPVDRRRTIARIRRSISRVQNLVNNLLDLGSLRAGTFRVRPRPMGLAGSVSDAVASLEPMLNAKRQNVVHRFEPDAQRVLADDRRVSQVLVNLVSNASKYGAPDEPITVSAIRSNGHVRVGVTDRGPGIPPAERETIFDRYYRSNPSGDAPGVGLGLAIVKAIVEAHGGQVGIDDAPEAERNGAAATATANGNGSSGNGGGSGITVWFTLPADAGERIEAL